ncbi:MAG: hypothetical protein ACLUB3_11650 [Clostridium sp.]
MRKNLKKQTAVLIVSAALAAQTSLAGYGAPLTPGDWKQEDGAWRFCDPEQNAYAGWVLTSSGWYYMDPSDGKMVTGWKQINGSRYYFETQQGKTEGKMHTGWYQDEQENGISSITSQVKRQKEPWSPAGSGSMANVITSQKMKMQEFCM